MSRSRYHAVATRSFLRSLHKVPQDVKTRALRAVDEILSGPYMGVWLRGELEGLWRWRIGNYRIIYMIEEEKGLVVFLDVGHRKAIY
ncbi:MAG: type II toxin-antitoxin system RelE/ParE family toxin [Candidatus Geothermarchaeales archaeon]